MYMHRGTLFKTEGAKLPECISSVKCVGIRMRNKATKVWSPFKKWNELAVETETTEG